MAAIARHFFPARYALVCMLYEAVNLPPVSWLQEEPESVTEATSTQKPRTLRGPGREHPSSFQSFQGKAISHEALKVPKQTHGGFANLRLMNTAPTGNLAFLQGDYSL